MTTYYVRRNGSDAAAGTSAGAAWATIGKALGAAGIASGDTVYVGPGMYREGVTVAMTAATGTTFVIGDTDGSHTGDPAGPVIWTGNTQTDWGVVSNTALTMTSKHFLAFSNIVFEQGVNVMVSLTTCHDITFTNCAFLANGCNQAGMTLTATVDIAANWTFDRCIFVGYGGGNGAILPISAPTSTSADYDLNVVITNCVFYMIGNANVCVVPFTTGANSFKPGGVKCRGCTCFGPFVFANSASMSTTIPCTVYDCFVMGGNVAVRANTTGQVIEDYNWLQGSTTRTNVTAGVHSVSSSTPTMMPRVSYGHETIWGGVPRLMGTPLQDSPLSGFGANTSPLTVDYVNRPRPGGVGRVVTSGTFTSGGTATATDSGATFGGDKQLVGAMVKITGGTGSGQTQPIKSHTQTVLTVYGTWNTQPDNTSTYAIYFGNFSFYGKATSGGATTLTQSNATWDTNMWAGAIVETTAGTGSGQTRTVTSNTATALTVPTWTTNPDSTTVYKIYRQTSESTVLNTVGALERHDTAAKETVLTDAGSVAWKIGGWGDQEIRIPVDASSTTISVKCSFDTDHGNTTKPQAVLVANPEIGVTTETKTATGTAGSGTFETLTFAAQTPSAKGFVRVRLCARSDKPTGRAVFDTIAVT